MAEDTPAARPAFRRARAGLLQLGRHDPEAEPCRRSPDAGRTQLDRGDADSGRCRRQPRCAASSVRPANGSPSRPATPPARTRRMRPISDRSRDADQLRGRGVPEAEADALIAAARANAGGQRRRAAAAGSGGRRSGRDHRRRVAEARLLVRTRHWRWRGRSGPGLAPNRVPPTAIVRRSRKGSTSPSDGRSSW